MTRLLFVFSVVVALGLVWAGTALAGSTTWEGHGSENLPCEDGGHWILSPGADVGTATLTVDGVSSTMEQSGPAGGSGAYHGFSSGPIDETTEASATWTGTSTEAFLKLSNCLEGAGDGGVSPGDDGNGDDGGTTDDGGVSPGGDDGDGGTTGVATTGGTVGVGGEQAGQAGALPFTGLPVWIPALAALALLTAGFALLRRRAPTDT
jgi:hypothetical protein